MNLRLYWSGMKMLFFILMCIAVLLCATEPAPFHAAFHCAVAIVLGVVMQFVGKLRDDVDWPDVYMQYVLMKGADHDHSAF